MVLIPVLFAGALLATRSTEAHVVPNHRAVALHRRAPSPAWVYAQKGAHDTYRHDEYEPYEIFRARYMAVGCPSQHNTKFFDVCCHARLQNATDASYPAACGVVAKNAAVPDAHAQVVEAEAYLEVAGTSNATVEAKAFGGAANVTVLLDVASENKTLAKALPDSAIKEAKAISLDIGDSESQTTQAILATPTPAPSSSRTSAAATTTSDNRAAIAAEAARQASISSAAAAAQESREAAASRAAAAEAAKKSQEAAASRAAAAEAAKKSQEAAQKAKEEQEQEQEDDDSGSDGGLFSNVVGKLFSAGTATWYEQAGTQGACGDFVDDDAKVIAISAGLYGFPNFDQKSKYCGKHVEILNKDNGKSVRAVVADGCPPCDDSHIDLSLGAFDAIGARDTGVLNIKWAFVD